MLNSSDLKNRFKEDFEELIDSYQNIVDGLTPITPQQFGAIGDGITDDFSAFQAMFDSIDISFPREIFIPAKSYLINSTLNLPDVKSGSSPLLIRGYGAVLKTTSAINILQRIPNNQAQAQIWVTSQIHIHGIEFTGSNEDNQNGILLSATYGASIRDCKFSNLSNGIITPFALMTGFENLLFTNIKQRGIHLTTGVEYWSGGGLANSQSNSCTIRNTRHYCKKGQLSCVYVEGVSGCYIDQIICEGANPINNIEFQQSGSTVVKEFTTRGIHLENTPSGAHIKLNTPVSGTYIFETIYVQPLNSVLIDSGNTPGNVLIVVKNLPWIPSGTKFNGTSAWKFQGYNNMKNIVINGNYWIDGNPRGAYFDEGGAIATAQGTVTSTSIGGANASINCSTPNLTLNGYLNIDLNCHPSYAIRVNGPIALENTSATTLGTVVGKVKVKDPSSGTVIGYLPLYDSIT